MKTKEERMAHYREVLSASCLDPSGPAGRIPQVMAAIDLLLSMGDLDYADIENRALEELDRLEDML